MPKKLIVVIYCLVAALFFMPGCGGDNDIDPVDPDAEPIIDTTLVFPAEGGTSRVSMFSYSSWKASVTSGESWCTLKPTSGGSGGSTLAVKVAPNSELVTRTAVINIKNKDARGTITVIQKQIDVLNMSVDGSCDFQPQGGSFAVTLDYNVDYTITCSEEWVHQAATKALSHDVLKFEVDRNVTGNDRSCTVMFEGAGLSHTVTVNQLGAYLHLSAGEMVIDAAQQAVTLNVSSNISYKITMPEVPDAGEGDGEGDGEEQEGEEESAEAVSWIAAPEQITAGEDGVPTEVDFEFKVEENGTYYIRDCKIAVESPDFEISDTLHVTQKAIDILSVELPPFESGPEGDSFGFELDPEAGGYEIGAGDAAGWISIGTQDDAPLRRVITVAKNATGEDRTGVVTIKCGEKENTLEFAQTAARIVFSRDELAFATGGGSVTLTLESNVEYIVTPPAETPWCAVEAQPDGSYTVTTFANENETGRECVILFDNEEYNVHESVKVVQAQKDVFQLQPTSFSFGPEGGSFSVDIHTNIDFDCLSDAEAWISEDLALRTADNRTYNVSLNDTGLPREGSLVFTGGEFTVTVKAEQGNAYILAGRHHFDFEDTPGMGIISIEHNVPFEIKVLDAPWLKMGNISSSQATFSVTENNEWGMRDGSIVLYNTAYNASDTITVHQDAKFYLDIEQMEFSLPPTGGTVEVEVTSNKEYSYQIEDGVDWVIETSPLVFTVAPNTTQQVRECQIVFEQKGFHKSVVITQAAPYLELSASSLSFPEEGGTQYFSFAGNIDAVEARADADWAVCHFEGGDKFSVSVSPNPVPQERYCTVTVESPQYGVSGQIRVTQAEKKVFYLLSPEFHVGPSAGDIKVDVSTNMEYIFEPESDWIKANGNLTFSISRNAGREERTGSIRFTAGDNDYYVTVVQDAPYLTADTELIEFPVEGGTARFSVSSNIPYELVLPNDDWLYCEELSENIYQVSAFMNGGDDQRECIIKVRSAAFGLEKRIRVVQDQSDMFKLLETGVELAPVASSFEVSLKTNMDYTYSISEDWVQDKGGLAFAADKNTGSEPRECLIEFTAGEELYTFTVTQQAPVFEVSPLEVAVDSLGGRITLDVNANIAYSVTPVEVPWLSLAESSSEGEVAFDVEELTKITTRSCNILFEADEFDISHTVRVTQTGVIDWYPFSVDVDTLRLGPVAREITVKHYKLDDVEVSLPTLGWIRELKDKGTDTTKVFAVDANLSAMTRKAIITLTGNEKSFPVVVVQEVPQLDLSVTDKNVSADGETLTVTFNANFIPSFTTTSNWIDIQPDIENNTVTFTIAANTTGEQRTSHIQAGDASLNYIRKMTFTQAANMMLQFDPSVIEVGWEGGDFTVTVTANVEYELSAMLAWLTAEETGQNTYLIHVGQNTSAYSRSGSVFLNSIPLQSKLSVVQSGYRNNDYYYSSDFSADGKTFKIQDATEGDGIPLILMGDAFTDRLIADGTYASAMNKAVEAFFAIEPYHSFRQYFNISYVNVVSMNEVYADDASTALSTKFGSGSVVRGDDKTVISRLGSLVSPITRPRALIIVVMNAPRYGGTTYLYNYPNASGDYGIGEAIVYIPLCTSDEEFTQVLQHEAGGHGFGKLADEYVSPSAGAIPNEVLINYSSLQKVGFYKNVSFTSNPDWVPWSEFLLDDRYQWEGLGVFEGACTYKTGVWRATENSMMRYNTGGFNAPSREAIFYRLHKLAFGSNWIYDFEEFVEYDEINIQQEPSLAPAQQSRRKSALQQAPLPPPVIIRQ